MIIKLFEEFEAKNVYNIQRRNRFSVEKDLRYEGGWNINYSSKAGKGKALIFDNTSMLKDIPKDMGNDEMYLFGIQTTPSNVGIGRDFLKDIFDYFDINRLYLPSSKDHPVWNKIASRVNKEDSSHLVLFTIDRNQIFSS